MKKHEGFAETGSAAGVRSDALPYSGALDGIRAVSIALVVGLHSPWLNTFPFNRGWVGVDIFFVLSGYLITTLLLRERGRNGTISLKHFYLRRALRILPPLYLWVAVLWLTKSEKGSVLILVLLYVANIAMASGRVGDGPAAHSWSLCLEEQFYLLWPWAVRWTTRRRLLIGTLCVLAAIDLWRILLFRMGVSGFPSIYMRPDTRTDAPLWGCAAALVEQEGWFASAAVWVRQRARRVLAALLAAGMVSFFLSWKWLGKIDYTVKMGFTLNAAIVAAIILWIRINPESLPVRLLGISPLAWIGRLSYSIYLWHRVGIQVGNRVADRWLGFSADAIPAGAGAGSRIVCALLWLSGILAVPAVSYYAFERPILKFKAKIGRPNRAAASPDG